MVRIPRRWAADWMRAALIESNRGYGPVRACAKIIFGLSWLMASIVWFAFTVIQHSLKFVAFLGHKLTSPIASAQDERKWAYETCRARGFSRKKSMRVSTVVYWLGLALSAVMYFVAAKAVAATLILAGASMAGVTVVKFCTFVTKPMVIYILTGLSTLMLFLQLAFEKALKPSSKNAVSENKKNDDEEDATPVAPWLDPLLGPSEARSGYASETDLSGDVMEVKRFEECSSFSSRDEKVDGGGSPDSSLESESTHRMPNGTVIDEDPLPVTPVLSRPAVFPMAQQNGTHTLFRPPPPRSGSPADSRSSSDDESFNGGGLMENLARAAKGLGSGFRELGFGLNFIVDSDSDSYSP